MPEGHLVHRYAREQHADLAGGELTLSSRRGRFDVAPFTRRALGAVEAYGKHLLYRFAGGGPALHVHLGMRGLFLRYDDPAIPARAGVRLRLAGDAVAYDLIAPARCEPLPADGERALLASLGPDPLRTDADADLAVRRLVGTRLAVGAALLDQAVWAGVGNAWRAELLFLAGLDPGARIADGDTARRLWDLAVRHLALGRESGTEVVYRDPHAQLRQRLDLRVCLVGVGPTRGWRSPTSSLA